MIDKSYRLDIIPMDNPHVIEVSQYDTDFQFLLLLYASEGTFTLESNTQVQMRGTKPNGTAYTRSLYMTGQSVLLDGDANLTDVAGIGTYEICLTHGTKYLSTSNFIIRVEPSPAERE